MNIGIIIQCASDKAENAGKLIAPDGYKVDFVANPNLVKNKVEGIHNFHPDDNIPGKDNSWRDLLVEYNQQKKNKLGLLKAGDLYKPRIYGDLTEYFGWENVYILSAGWGLVRSDYLLPDYNITFSSTAGPGKKRKKNMLFKDFNHLENRVSNYDQIHFFGTPSYLPLFYELTSMNSHKFVIHYADKYLEYKPGYKYEPYERTFTNWHYSCAKEFLDKIQNQK